jgi:small-conductance mechanosensitive channel
MKLSHLLKSLNIGTGSWQMILFAIIAAIIAVGIGLIVASILGAILKHWGAGRKFTSRDLSLPLQHWVGPLRAVIPALFLLFILPALELSKNAAGIIRHILGLWVIAAVAWLIARTVSIIRDFLLSFYQLDVKDNLRARRVYTQVRVIQRVISVIIILVAISIMLMTFDKVRQLGVSLLASAGVVGIILGIAAQKSLGTLFAGIQIAIAEPVRIDDVVIVEGEWGRIEEITLTYVVVRIWDLRRLIVPITYFIEKPFQNWTRISADLLGTVYLYMDYTVPVQVIRDEFNKILGNTDMWDKKVSGVQVTNSTEHTMEIRALMSAPDSSTAWNLRCHVREKLIEFLQKNYPQSLPKSRVVLEKEDQEKK